MILISYFLICVFNYLIVGELVFKMLKKIIFKSYSSYLILDSFLLQIIAYALVLPILVTILYYGFLFLPGYGHRFYLLLIICIPISLYLGSKKSAIPDSFILKEKLFSNQNFAMFFLVIVLLQVVYLNFKGITENDYLEYGILGNYFFETRNISYQPERFLPESFFYYVGLHGFTFPLAKSYECLINVTIGIKSDFYYKSISGVYSILTLLFFFRIATKFLSIKQSLLALGIFAFTYGFFIISLRYHIDTFRLFFFLVSVLFLIESISIFNAPIAIVSGIILGTHSFAHSLGVFIAVFWIFSLMINSYAKKSFNLLHYLYLIFAFLLFGGGHYILDIFIGTGWIFQEIDFY